MNPQNEFSWMIKPKSFIKLLGGEYELMHKAGGKVLSKFYLSAIVILFIAVLSFLSIFYAIELLFHAVVLEIILSLFLSSLFVLLFIFIVNTFTKDARQRRLFNFSNVTRLGFVMFIGFIISKPIEAFIYRDDIEVAVEKRKAELIKYHNSRIDLLFNRDLKELLNSKNRYNSLNVKGGFTADILKIDQQIQLIDFKKNNLSASSAFRIEQGAHFIYRIKTISVKFPRAWLISLSVVILFLLPVYLIYSISSDEEYFKRKHAQEKRMVEKAYHAFTQKYADTFLDKYGLHLEFYSNYEDPPFNTSLKKPPVCKTPNDFHERYAQV